MRAIELHLTNKLFRVTEDEIYPVSIQGLELKGDILHITFDSYKACVNKGDTYCKNRYETPYYFTLEDAQTAQMFKRKEAINKAFEALQKANEAYNGLIQKWFDKPAHNPYENKD